PPDPALARKDPRDDRRRRRVADPVGVGQVRGRRPRRSGLQEGLVATDANEGWPAESVCPIGSGTASGPSPRMTKPLRLLLFSAAVACVALGGAAHALGGGKSNGSSYVTIGASSNAYGISARIAQLNAPQILNGNVTGFVRVDGREGPLALKEWLQVGSGAFPVPGITGEIYYEVALPRKFPAYHEVSTGVPLGTYTKVTVLEMRNRPNQWRVWVNHKPVSPPILLPGSHVGLRATAKSTCWDGGTDGTCNDFPYSF